MIISGFRHTPDGCQDRDAPDGPPPGQWPADLRLGFRGSALGFKVLRSGLPAWVFGLLCQRYQHLALLGDARSIHGQRLKKGTRILAHTHESACRGSHSLQGSPFPPPWDSNVFYRTSAKGKPRDLYTVQLQLCYVSVPYGALPAQLIIPELPLVLVPQSSSAFGCLSSTLPGSTSALPWTLPALVALAHRHVGSLELPQMSLDRTVMERIPQDLRLGDTFLQQQLLQQAPNLRNEGFEQGGGGPKWYQTLGLGIRNSGLFLSLSHGLKSFSDKVLLACSKCSEPKDVTPAQESETHYGSFHCVFLIPTRIPPNIYPIVIS